MVYPGKLDLMMGLKVAQLRHFIHSSGRPIRLEIAVVEEEDETVYIFLPQLYKSEDCKVPINPQELEELIDESTMCPADCRKEFQKFALTVINALT